MQHMMAVIGCLSFVLLCLLLELFYQEMGHPEVCFLQIWVAVIGTVIVSAFFTLAVHPPESWEKKKE